MGELIFLLLVIGAWILVSRRLESTVVSAPMVFLVAGIIFSFIPIDKANWELQGGTVLFLAQVALALTLFTDASRMNLRSARGNVDLPSRMLSIGLPLTIVAGTALALTLLTGLTIWEAAILGTILAPTDASLGQAVVNSPKVPLRIRQALNIEAGLNDGLSVPLLVIFIALASAEEGLESARDAISLIGQEIGLGILFGLIVGYVGAGLAKKALATGWMSSVAQRLALPALAILSWALADAVGGSGLIAAFVAGISAAWIFGKVNEEEVGFIESEGQMLDYTMFFIFGTAAAVLLSAFTPIVILYALISLTLARMIPVALSLIGKDLTLATKAFLGWFGPRGLASIVLLLVVMEEAPGLAGLDQIVAVASATILLSIFVHGLSTNPLIKSYGAYCQRIHPAASEHKSSAEPRTRKSDTHRENVAQK